MSKNGNRIIGLDIFRIISMCGIVGLHIMNNGGIIASTDQSSLRFPFLLLLLTIFFLSVNSFAVLSGYLLIEKKKRGAKRIIDLIMTVIVIAFVMTAVFYVFNINDIRSYGMSLLAKSLFPFGFYYWYITCYIFLFFMIPYINKFVASIDRKVYRRLLITVGALLSIIPTLFLNTDFFRINDGYSPFWLIFCYLVGGYIKLYPPKIETKKCFIGLIVSILAMVVLNYIWRFVSTAILGHCIRDTWLIGYTSPLNLYASAILLVLFSRIKDINKAIINKIIISLSSAAFTVYIFHDQYIFFYHVLKDSFIFTNELAFVVQIAIIICAIIIIYLFGFIVEKIRKLIFKYLRIDSLCTLISMKIDGKGRINEDA